MKKKRRSNILLRAILMIIGLPVVIISILFTLLYLPPVQRTIVEKACKEIGSKSGFDVEIGSISLSFPLKLKATDFRISRNDSTYFQGESIDADISLLPLFKGKVEINYLSLEELDLNTRDMLPEYRVDGKVGHARVVVRNADLASSVADIRQLYIAHSDINITLADTTVNEESELPQWTINLHSGRIKECNIGIDIPHDTLAAGMHIDELQLNKGTLDIAAMGFGVRSLALENSGIWYDKGTGTAQDAPLDHIRLSGIAFNAEELKYTSPEDIKASITHLSLEQPGGFAITDAAADFTSGKDSIMLQKLEINSTNGSYIHGECIIPRQALLIPINTRFTANLLVGLNRRDLAALVTPPVYDKLNFFNENILNANVELSGNIHNISIDTIGLAFPGVGTLGANGEIRHILKKEKMDCNLAFDGQIDNITRITDSNAADTINCSASVKGNIQYMDSLINADIALNCQDGVITADGSYNIADTAYNARINVERLALSAIMPGIPLHNLSMKVTAKGKGTDILSNSMQYDADITIDTLHYAGYRLHSITAKALQANSISTITIDGNDKNLMFGIDATTALAPTGIGNRTSIELTNADFRGIGVVDSTLKISTNIDIVATSDFKETHTLKITGDGTSIVTSQHRFTPASLMVDFATSPQRTSIMAKNGDLDLTGKMDCGYNKLFDAMEEIAAMNRKMMSGNIGLYHLGDYEKVLPRILLDFNCGEKNILHNFLAFKGVATKGININADISQSRGLNVKGHILKFGINEMRLDSIKFATRQRDDRLDYIIGASDFTTTSTGAGNSQTALVYGNIQADTVTTNLLLRDNVKKSDSKIGLTAHIKPGNMHIRFAPEAMLLGAPFTFGQNSYINIGKAMSVDADVTFTGGNDNGLHIYTTPDKEAKYNISLDLFNIHLSKIAEAVPAMPVIGGTLGANINYRKLHGDDMLVGSTDVKGLTYNGHTVGNERIEFSYTPGGGSNHNIKCAISHNGNKVAGIESGYRGGTLDGNISITRLPLDITRAFIDKEGAMIDGYLDSRIDFAGTLSQMKSHGHLQFDSTYVYSPMLGATLHFAEDIIMIEDSKVNFKGYHIYDKANTPFVIDGDVEMANMLNPKLNLRLNASDYEILNTPREAGKTIYGKMFVDLRSMIRGTLDDIRMMGNLTILSNSNFSYLIPESAFETSKELDGLVEFVNFNDTTAVVQQEQQAEIDLGNIIANMNIKVEEGAKLSLDFDAARDNYITFDGDGNLNATYDSDNGLNVTGIYKLNGGQLKLTLPIIPLKTFHIQDGGRLTWTGDLFNPMLEITALEKTTVSVEFEDNSIQPVIFNTGVVIGNDVNDMSIGFTMSSPENSVIQEQLNQLDKETLSRYAVAMIITGTYLGGRQGVTAASALSSFLDAKINDISGTAIKNFDVNIGINDALNAEGGAYTNYSFSFSKRFLNDRMTVVIGGEVNSGDRPDKNAGNETFINNVSLEWKLNKAGNRHLRIFYDKDYRSLLEGEITETGVGYVYKRKLNRLRELFIFKRKEKRAKNDETEKKQTKK